MKTAYSFIRFSTLGQAKGDSKRRQLEAGKTWCKENGYTLSNDVFFDAGKSAFKGEHLRAKGELRRFLNLVEDGTVKQGSLLLVENFDRISRLPHRQSLALFLQLINAGIGLVFTLSFDKRIIDAELVDKDGAILQMVVGECIRAHAESSRKSVVISATKQEKIRRLKAGEILAHNNVPKYLSFDKETKIYHHNDNTPLVRRLVKDFLAGNSLYSIAKTFNAEKIKTFRRGFEWSARSVRCILTNRVLIGEFLGNKKFNKPMVAQDDFDKVQGMLGKHSKYNVKGRSGSFVNIFRGLAYCSECEKRMHVVTQSFNYHTGKPYPNAYRYLRCSSHATGKECSNRQVMIVAHIEHELFMEFLMQTPAELLAGNNVEAKEIGREILTLETKKQEIDKQIDRLVTVNKNLNLEQFTKQAGKLKLESDKVQERLDTLANDLRQVEGAPVDFKNLKSVVGSPKFDFWKYDQRVRKVMQSLEDNETRKQIRVLLPPLLGRIKCYTQAGGDDNGAWEVLNNQGKVIYRSMSFGN